MQYNFNFFFVLLAKVYTVVQTEELTERSSEAKLRARKQLSRHPARRDRDGARPGKGAGGNALRVESARARFKRSKWPQREKNAVCMSEFWNGGL